MPPPCESWRVDGASLDSVRRGPPVPRRIIAEFGGSPGVRDRGAIESVLNSPKNLFAYGNPDLFDLAAAYTSGLNQNHRFVDGNKRTAFVTGAVFLGVNGYRVEAEQAEVVAAMLSLADHTIDEAGYTQWLRDHAVLHATVNREGSERHAQIEPGQK